MSNKTDSKNDNDNSDDDSYDNECVIDDILKTEEVINAQDSLDKISLSKGQYDPQKFIKDKIFSLEGIERRKELFHLNLIHYDENMKNSENIDYYKRFKLNVVGGFHAIDNFEIFKKFMEKMKNNQNKIHYILITSGSASEKIMKYCHDFEFIKEIIIFCGYLNKYKKMYDINTEMGKKFYKLKLISANYTQVENYLSKIKFDDSEIAYYKQLTFTPIICYFEYEKCYFSIHRLISYFFDEEWNTPKYTEECLTKIKKCIEKISDIQEKDKSLIKSTVKKLKQSNNFGEDCVKTYTAEGVYKILNKVMRDIGRGYIDLVYFFGPYDYGFFKYLHDNTNKGINSDITLERNIALNELDYYVYTLSEGEIICFPAFTSTSTISNNPFSPTPEALKLNGIDPKTCKFVKMIFHYYYKKGTVSPGIDVDDISSCKGEKEVLLLPFTFVKFNKINKKDERHFEFDFTIINQSKYLEFILKNSDIDSIKKKIHNLINFN